MALTKNGCRIGAAAHLENLDMREYVRQSAAESFSEKWFKALNRLKAIDPLGWEEWYDNCVEQTAGEMLPRIKERIAKMEQVDIADWLDLERAANVCETREP